MSRVEQLEREIRQLSLEEQSELFARLHGWNDDEWDAQMKADLASGKLDAMLREVDEEIRTGKTQPFP